MNCAKMKSGSRFLYVTRSAGGRWDSNPRQPEPQSGALPLNYVHHWCSHSRAAAIYTLLQWNASQILHLSAFFNFLVTFFVTSQALEREFSGAGSYVSQRLWKNSPKQHKGIVFCVKIRSGVSDASPSAVSFHLCLYRRKPLTFNLSIVNCQS